VHSSIVNILAELKAAGVPQPERNEIEYLMDDWTAATPERKATIREKFSAWCARNAGNIGEFTGKGLRAFFG